MRNSSVLFPSCIWGSSHGREAWLNRRLTNPSKDRQVLRRRRRSRWINLWTRAARTQNIRGWKKKETDVFWTAFGLDWFFNLSTKNVTMNCWRDGKMNRFSLYQNVSADIWLLQMIFVPLRASKTKCDNYLGSFLIFFFKILFYFTEQGHLM